MAETIGVRLKEDVIQTIEQVGDEEKADKSATLRKLIEKGIAQWRLERALILYGDGKITLWKAAEIADVALWEMLEISETKKIPFNYDLDEMAHYVHGKFGKLI